MSAESLRTELDGAFSAALCASATSALYIPILEQKVKRRERGGAEDRRVDSELTSWSRGKPAELALGG